MPLFPPKRMEPLEADELIHRFSVLESSVNDLSREVRNLRTDLHNKITKTEIESFLKAGEERIEEAVQSAERLQLRKQELGKMIGHLAEIRKKVEYVDPKIREVFLDLNERIRHAEKLIKRMDGKIEKNQNKLLKD